MSIELYLVLIGIFRAGLVAMFLDPSAGLAHINRCCALQTPRALIGGPKAHLLRLVSPALRAIPLHFVIGQALPFTKSFSAFERLAPLAEITGVGPDHPALLTFTSGSTGQPKAAVRSHGFLLAQHRVLEKSIHLLPGETDLTTLPVFILANLGSGVTSIIPDADLKRPGFIQPRPVLEQISKLRTSRTAGSPAFYERLLEELESRTGENTLTPKIKVYTGGAPVFPGLLKRLSNTFQVAPEAVYGSSEAEPIAHLNFADIGSEDFTAMRLGKGLLAGRPVPDIELRIMKDQWGTPLGSLSSAQFKSLTLPAEAPGEIVVNGAHVLTTYLHGHGNEETKFLVEKTIWHRTGDAGYLDTAGRLWLLGRCLAKMNDAQGTLYPFAVECVAHQFVWVHRAGCVGLEGNRWLAVQLQRTPAPREFLELEQALDWAGLSGIVQLPHLPVDKRHNAKIDYVALRQMLAQSLAKRRPS